MNDFRHAPIEKLPQSMAERALFARQAFIDNAKKCQIDDEFLVWAFSEKDEQWYSIAGNYSKFSPEEKRSKNKQWREYYEKNLKTAEDLALNYYKDIIYTSKLRVLVLENDDYTCQKCGKVGDSRLHIHHIHKRVEGGLDTLDNLITLCPGCHKVADTKEYAPVWKKHETKNAL